MFLQTLLFLLLLDIARAETFLPNDAPPGPIVDVGYASFLGNDSIPGVEFFGGIRYVQPPLGDLRWRVPQIFNETPREHNITDARTWGSICMQQPAEVGFGSEDCLTLNIWKSSTTQAGDNLPVALYIHGGGNYANSAQGFPMNTWITENNGSIVAVNIQYRLGLWGFLASSVVHEDGDLNVGLLDQRAALDWVRRHIYSFGGDPAQITVAGQSAGSADIVHQMVSYGGQGEPPFQAAIAESIGMDPFLTSEQYEYCFANATAIAGCTSVINNSSEVMSCMRAAPLSALVAAVNNRPSGCSYLPIVDGSFLPDLPTRLLTRGEFHKMPFIGGHVTDDGSIFVENPADFTNTTEEFMAALRKRYTFLSNTTAERMIELYPESDFPSQWERAKTAFGDTVFTCMDWYIASLLIAEGRTDVYNYRFNTPDPVQLAANPWEGVMHTSELFFLFQGTNSGPSPSDPVARFAPFNASEQVLSTETIGYWTSFARAYNPNTYKPLASSPEWLNAASLARLVNQEGNTTSTESHMEQQETRYIERCLFWMAVGNDTRV